ncbi:MAG: hypothetical protein QOG74_678 [Alphaproteobacteria bacterium]|jgi:hypothetical protein|nr:hypothetical protein [Alphaproteobacteria bacterium]
MPMHATAHLATLDDGELSATAVSGGALGWFSLVVSRFLPPRNSAVGAGPGPAKARWYETQGAVRGF